MGHFFIFKVAVTGWLFDSHFVFFLRFSLIISDTDELKETWEVDTGTSMISMKL